MRKRVISVVVLLALAGCSNSGTSDPKGGADISLGASAPLNSNNHLTGFDATITNWNAHHDADPDPSLVSNCCYGPQIKFYGQTSMADTWAAVMSDGGVVDSLIHDFSPGTSRAEALAALERDDLPADATLISSKVGDGCELFLYSSDSLAAADPEIGSHISFDFVSPPDESVYYPNNIWHADLSAAGSLGAC
jgi:hypothetical protein